VGSLKKNSALAGFCERFQAILNAFDEYEMDEEMEELNAQFEDTLFLMETIDEEDEDADEEIEGALEGLEDLLTEYTEICPGRSELSQKVSEFEMCLRMAQLNLK